MIEEENNNELEDEDELDVEMMSPENVLMYSTLPGPRIFTLQGSHEAVLGLLLEETDDSFLVGMPARMIMPVGEDGKVDLNGEKTIQPFVPLPYFRLFKNAIMSVMYAFGEFEAKYMNYVEAKGGEIYPQLADYYDADDRVNMPEADLTEVTVAEEAVGLEQEAAEARVEILGMSDEDLEKYLTEKYNNGDLPGGSRKKQ